MADRVNVKITLNDGREMNLELYPEVAPVSVANFTKLAESGFYDGLCFHRVIDGFMIQGGGMTHTPAGLVPKDGSKTIKGEFAANGVNNPLGHSVGVISMARTPVFDSASSQFFICVADVHSLDGQYAAFGKCSDNESIEVAKAIAKVPTGNLGYYQDVPRKPIVIKSIRVVK